MEDAPVPAVDVDPGKRREIVSRVMRRQITLSLQVAAVFIVLLIAIPLFNLYAPQVAHQEVLGFSLTWLILGILFFPITWILSAYFVHASEKVESKLVAEYALRPVIEAVPVINSGEEPRP